MYRVVKALNHNAVLAADVSDQKEYLLMGKGIGFGKKVSEQFEADESCRVYSLTDRKERNDVQDLAKSINPEFLEIANMVLECRASVNILMADTQDIGGIATGQMILQLPEENQTADKMIAYLREKNLTVEELKDYVE